jgi:predicted nucleic acid-binding protein
MSDFADTSILVSSVVPDDADHEACDRLLATGALTIYLHAVAETFSSLTGGRESIRVDPATAATLIEQSILPFVTPVALSLREVMEAVKSAHSRGVRGGAIYDFLHLTAARKAHADRVYTLNVRHFRAFHRPGDPEIVHP